MIITFKYYVKYPCLGFNWDFMMESVIVPLLQIHARAAVAPRVPQGARCRSGKQLPRGFPVGLNWASYGHPGGHIWGLFGSPLVPYLA